MMGRPGSVVVCVLLLGLSALALVPEIDFLIQQYQQNTAACAPGCHGISQWSHAGKLLFAASFTAVVGLPLIGAMSGLLLGRRWDVTARIASALGGVLVGALLALALGAAFLIYEIGTNGFAS